jgi:murein DD-endopeptidase MepM/ murein hydrolase activator NlpD
MSQRLILPFVRSMMLCGYKTAQYLAHWGYPHYGIDVSTIQGGAGDDPAVYASGSGTVLAAGKDAKLGYGLAILYPGAVDHRTGEARDLIARYMHLREIYAREGDRVSLGDRLGLEGKEGTGDYHLHLELDADAREEYARWSPQVSSGLTFWVHGVDSTVNPSNYLHIGPGQSLADPTYNPAWLNPGDFAIPPIPDSPEDTVPREEYEAMKAKYENLSAAVRGLADSIEKEE